MSTKNKIPVKASKMLPTIYSFNRTNTSVSTSCRYPEWLDENRKEESGFNLLSPHINTTTGDSQDCSTVIRSDRTTQTYYHCVRNITLILLYSSRYYLQTLPVSYLSIIPEQQNFIHLNDVDHGIHITCCFIQFINNFFYFSLHHPSARKIKEEKKIVYSCLYL